MDNYPDDIRQYDNDPRSPFYPHPPIEECSTCGEGDWVAGDIDCDADGYYNTYYCTNDKCETNK